MAHWVCQGTPNTRVNWHPISMVRWQHPQRSRVRAFMSTSVTPLGGYRQ